VRITIKDKEILKLNSKKPASTAAVSSELDVTTFKVKADPSCNSDRINVKADQQEGAFVFTCVASKFDTEVRVTIAGRKLTFHLTHSFDDVENGEEVVRTVKAKQTFTLPMDVALESFQILPDPAGQKLKVLKDSPKSSKVGGTYTIPIHSI